eukprot:TRINITY_DN2362_c0_g1_i3.p1 TRINITY_DN2362_c0_g1~~TRINITY_DN2362_c0_g1_i3.p1  ORF type:complete len:106 (-),score=31.11 TRINITY_DN2362_c0_g1_i3:140-457(-)
MCIRDRYQRRVRGEAPHSHWQPRLSRARGSRKHTVSMPSIGEWWRRDEDGDAYKKGPPEDPEDSETAGMLSGNSRLAELNAAIEATKSTMTENIGLELDLSLIHI